MSSLTSDLDPSKKIMPKTSRLFVESKNFCFKMIESISNSGLTSLFRGNMSGQYKNLAKISVTVLGYDKIKKMFMPRGDLYYSGADLFMRRYIAAIFCGLLTVGVTQPFELAHTLCSADFTLKGKKKTFGTVFDCLNQT